LKSVRIPASNRLAWQKNPPQSGIPPIFKQGLKIHIKKHLPSGRKKKPPEQSGLCSDMEQTPSLNAVTLRFRKEKCVRGKTLCGFFPRDFHQPAAAPQSAPPVPFGPESSEANRVRKRRNSHQSAVFGKAGNGTVVGISELVRAWGLEPQRIAAREPKSRMSTNFIMPAYLSGGVCSRIL
jgi:hypothetical protein